jgi:hypothetical protein
LDQGARLREEHHSIYDRAIQDKGDRRFTEHALDYADLPGYEILKLKGLGCVDDEKERGQISTVRFLSTDDKEYTVEHTVRK